MTFFSIYAVPAYEIWLFKSLLFILKGGWENDETVVEAASREAFEEAGVKGILNVRSFIPAAL